MKSIYKTISMIPSPRKRVENRLAALVLGLRRLMRTMTQGRTWSMRVLKATYRPYGTASAVMMQMLDKGHRHVILK